MKFNIIFTVGDPKENGDYGDYDDYYDEYYDEYYEEEV